ncbi:Por secretion system C-terminal sorting domain-containing protein [Paenimyroides ummariense]|uniref:Por secretion system C-terminal sorting domain-containing protein n=1 Tax=Paenimyroides ummariense TaxID=913024 RepID=A0A1I5BAX9_9FLAO|nr:T9SS type A sorting domain-containing protein [Paenimyroides ummariense]SFN71691.1 Por secretion system C-terminal sorting domain-containing protein [Paenimyroides ummariense]
MKKHLFFLVYFSVTLTANSQVVYTENFDNHSVGTLGTDFTGTIPGQWGWVTKSKITQTNIFFTIVNEANRGKVLDITALSHSESLLAFKPGIDQVIDNRTPGNDVIKFEIDYFTGSIQANASSSSWINLIPVGEVEGGLINPPFLCRFDYNKQDGSIASSTEFVSSTTPVQQNTFLPFNTWVKLTAYLDYPNRKVYFEIPSLNKVFVSDFLKNDPSTNLIEDYKPSIISLIAGFTTSTQNPQTVTRNRYDNIKITALAAVPPEVINLSVNEQLATKFNLYPNPVTSLVNITNSENMVVQQVTVYDISGKQLNTQSFNNETQIQLNVENLASGTYMLHIQTNEGLAVKKLIKK